MAHRQRIDGDRERPVDTVVDSDRRRHILASKDLRYRYRRHGERTVGVPGAVAEDDDPTALPLEPFKHPVVGIGVFAEPPPQIALYEGQQLSARVSERLVCRLANLAGARKP